LAAPLLAGAGVTRSMTTSFACVRLDRELFASFDHRSALWSSSSTRCRSTSSSCESASGDRRPRLAFALHRHLVTGIDRSLDLCPTPGQLGHVEAQARGVPNDSRALDATAPGGHCHAM
jgi:hypothetical protein